MKNLILVLIVCFGFQPISVAGEPLSDLSQRIKAVKYSFSQPPYVYGPGGVRPELVAVDCYKGGYCEAYVKYPNSPSIQSFYYVIKILYPPANPDGTPSSLPPYYAAELMLGPM